MSRLVRRAGVRFALRKPLSAAVPVLGVALGVAVVLGVDLAGAGALDAMTEARQTLSGAATHQIQAPSRPLRTEAFARTLEIVGHGNAAPVVERAVLVPDPRQSELDPGSTSDEVFTLLGIDPFSEARFRDFLDDKTRSDGFAAFLTEPGAALISRGTADRLGLELSSRFALHVGGRIGELNVTGILEAPRGSTSSRLDSLLITDLATAHEVTGPPHGFDRIDLRLDAERAEEQLVALAEALPEDAQVDTAASNARSLENLTRSFRENLRALSLLSLFVGAFLVYSTLAFWVTQRRESIALLRLVGASSEQVLRSVLAQALLLGSLGTALGLGLGLLLSGGLTALVTRTIGDLYTAVRVTALESPVRSFVTATGLGLGTTVLASLGPALEAARLPARRALGASFELDRSQDRAGLRRFSALTLLVLGAIALPFAAHSSLFGYLGLFGWLSAACLASPDVFGFCLDRLAPVAKRIAGSFGGLAVRGARAALPRTWVATSALLAALAATTAIAIVIASFRSSVATWIGHTLVADLYISAPSAVRARSEPTGIDPEIVRRVANLPEVEGLHLVRRVNSGSPLGEIELAAVDLPEGSGSPYRVLSGDFEGSDERWRTGQAILISEPLATRLDLEPEDLLQLATPTGPLELPIAGVFRDYATERGYAVLDHELYVGRYRDGSVSSIAVELTPSTNETEALDRVRSVIPRGQLLQVSSNRALRENTLRVFDRTFEITGVLRLLTLIVAGVGIFSALFGLALDRDRELGVLRAVGATPGQVFALVTGWSCSLGLMAGVFSVPLGVVLAHVLARYVNRPAFGWSLDGLTLSVPLAAGTVLLAVVLSAAAAFLPAWRCARRSPARALREE